MQPWVVGLIAVALVAAACSASTTGSDSGVIQAVGAENQYANVISQIGGRYVHASAVMSNPSADPHSFEASPSVARTVGAAKLVVQNGLGYDPFMATIEKAAPNAGRKVIDVQSLLRLPDSTANPHLWYDPTTMPQVAKQVAADLSALDPPHASTFQANLATFDTSLDPWRQAIASLKASQAGAPVAVTEPVADYLLQAAGADIRTPPEFEAEVMNGVDPSPQDVAQENSLLTSHAVKALLYNQQVADSLTQGFLATASSHNVPVVGVYETMPAGFTYQSWMLAETQALQKAVASGVSTRKLP